MKETSKAVVSLRKRSLISWKIDTSATATITPSLVRTLAATTAVVTTADNHELPSWLPH